MRNESEITENEQMKQRKRLGSRGPVVIIDPLQPRFKYDEKKNIEYKDFSVVKLGCNKCSDVFYSEGGYNAHLFKQHKIRNVAKYPPTVINKIWSRIPEKEHLLEGQHECDVCGARYFEISHYYRHRDKCRKKTVEQEEDRQADLYRLFLGYQKELEEGGEDGNKSSQIIDEEEPEVKKTRRSRSKKRKWTTTKRRTRKSSDVSEPRSKVFIKTSVDGNDLSKSQDRMSSVEFYKDAEGTAVSSDDKKLNDMDTSTQNDSTITAESKHAPDTDFHITTSTELSSEISTEDPLPTIKPPTSRYQLRSRSSQPKNEERRETTTPTTDEKLNHDSHPDDNGSEVKDHSPQKEPRNEGAKSEISENEDADVTEIHAEKDVGKRENTKLNKQSKIDKDPKQPQELREHVNQEEINVPNDERD